MDRPDDLPVVPCLDCDTPCITPVSRARRVGAGCWRKRRAIARRLAAASTASTLPVDAQDGPSLLDQLEVTHV
ncbi:hypothetical protein KIF24_01990 [Micromonospora sp. Llam7]|uniref:hypothetical protein n=1 Tax=Micromonospora tarapacensis TaxID=2835305 RepID=UPI001C8330B8|nr:hypothetical protein [Micromonospora tarapacensis]MBX7264945.1 hypothetical protein [Micromonospora tarapacensis]